MTEKVFVSRGDDKVDVEESAAPYQTILFVCETLTVAADDTLGEFMFMIPAGLGVGVLDVVAYVDMDKAIELHDALTRYLDRPVEVGKRCPYCGVGVDNVEVHVLRCSKRGTVDDGS